jgi:hypothetical protein
MKLISSKIMNSVERKSCTEQEGEYKLFHVWCCKAMTDKRYHGFTELLKLRVCFSGSIWRAVPSKS